MVSGIRDLRGACHLTSTTSEKLKTTRTLLEIRKERWRITNTQWNSRRTPKQRTGWNSMTQFPQRSKRSKIHEKERKYPMPLKNVIAAGPLIVKEFFKNTSYFCCWKILRASSWQMHKALVDGNEDIIRIDLLSHNNAVDEVNPAVPRGKINANIKNVKKT